MAYFPFMMEVENRQWLIVGGGKVALHKIEVLRQFHTGIRVVAREVCEEIRTLAKEDPLLDFSERDLETSDLETADFVITATDDAALNRYVSDYCIRRRIPVNAVDKKDLCSFIFPALIREDHFTAAFSTEGASPSAAADLKRRARAAIPDYYSDMIGRLGELRPFVIKNTEDPAARKRIMAELLAYGEAHQGEIPDSIAEELVGRPFCG